MQNSQSLTEKTKSSKEVFKGKLLHIFYDEAILPDGSISSREWIKHPGACAIVPIFENGDVMLIDQYRYPAKKLFLEVPAGKIDSGEHPDDTAKRELLEETGLSANKLEKIGHLYPAIGYADEIIHIYIAKGLLESTENTDDDEFVIKKRLPFVEAIEMVHSGEIDDAKTITCLLRAEYYLRKNN
jgi:ADP-ribose pyrophosphatase